MPSGVVSIVADEAAAAASAWASQIDVGETQMPTVQFNGSPTHSHTVTIMWETGHSGSNYCGYVRTATGGTIHDDVDTPGRIIIHACTGGNASLAALLTHELAHVYGFQDSWHNDHYDTTYGPGCARYIREGVGNAVCRHEIEDLYYEYGVRSTWADLDNPFVVSVGLAPSSPTIEVGSSVLLEASVGVHDEVNLSPPDPSHFTYTWSRTGTAVSNPSANTGASASVHGSNAGTSNVSAIPNATSSYNIAAVLHVFSAVVTVVAPPTYPDSLQWNMSDCFHTVDKSTHIVTLVASVDTSAIPSTDTWEIAETMTNSPPGSSPTILAGAGGATRSDTLAPYYTSGAHENRYFWGRRVMPGPTYGPWAPDAVNHPGTISSCGWF
jgi:hypothetical protein